MLQIGMEIGADRTVPVFCSVGNLGDVLPGAYLSGLIETGSTNVSALPAAVGFEGKDYIFTAAQADH